MRLGRQHSQLLPRDPRHPARLADYGLVAPMEAIEIAERHDHTPPIRRQIFGMPDDLHYTCP